LWWDDKTLEGVEMVDCEMIDGKLWDEMIDGKLWDEMVDCETDHEINLKRFLTFPSLFIDDWDEEWDGWSWDGRLWWHDDGKWWDDDDGEMEVVTKGRWGKGMRLVYNSFKSKFSGPEKRDELFL